MESLQVATPATLHHLHLTSAQPERLSGFYERLLEYRSSRADDGTHVLSGGERRLLISKGENGAASFIAYAVRDVESLEKLRGRTTTSVGSLEAVRSPLFAEGSFAIRD